MLLRIAVVGTLIVAGSFLADPAVSQTQRQSQTLGSPPTSSPMPDVGAPAGRKNSRAARRECTAQAKQQKLRGRQRTAFIRECMSKS